MWFTEFPYLNSCDINYDLQNFLYKFLWYKLSSTRFPHINHVQNIVQSWNIIHVVLSLVYIYLLSIVGSLLHMIFNFQLRQSMAIVRTTARKRVLAHRSRVIRAELSLPVGWIVSRVYLSWRTLWDVIKSVDKTGRHFEITDSLFCNYSVISKLCNNDNSF